MTSSRATSGVEVQVDLSGRRVRSGLEHELRDAVRSGRLAAGTRLPSSRTLARDLGISRNSVADAFAQLVAEGWFVSRLGAGTWVADRSDVLPDPAGSSDPGDAADAAAGEALDVTPPVRFDLRPGVPDLAAFPRTDWLAAARRALAVAPDDVLGYGDPRGLPVLREALAGYLARARRVTVGPGRIVVCAGFTQALALVAGVLRARGATALAVEAYGHRLHHDILHHAGLTTVALPVDARGAVVATLDDLTTLDHPAGLDGRDAGKAARSAPPGPTDPAAPPHHPGAGNAGRGERPGPAEALVAAHDRGAGGQGDRRGASGGGAGGVGGVLLTPAHQFPLGVALDPARRRQVVGWAAEAGAVVIEDDYDGEFRYDRQAVGAVQSLAPDHVVYAGTAAKTLAPGLRLAWLVLPAGLVDEVVESKRRRGIFPSAIDQLTLAELIVSGAFDRHVRRARLAYRRRRDRLVAALAREVPGVEVSGIAAGLHALVHLTGAATEAEVIAGAAADHGLALEGLGAYTEPGHERDPALVVGYATPPDHAYTATLARLTATLTP